MSDSVRPHRRQPTRLCHPWDSLGKNAGVGWHFLLQCRKVYMLVKLIGSQEFCQNKSLFMGFLGGSAVKNPPAMLDTQVWSQSQEDSPIGGQGNPLLYSCWGNPTNRGDWRATVHGVAKSWTWLKRLKTHSMSFF